MTAAAQQRAPQLGMKSKLAIHFGGKCPVKRKFFSKKGDLEDRWAEGTYMGLSPSANDGHIVLRSDGVGNGFVQTLHVRTRLVSPDPPPLQFVGDSLEEEHSAPPRRVRGLAVKITHEAERTGLLGLVHHYLGGWCGRGSGSRSC